MKINLTQENGPNVNDLSWHNSGYFVSWDFGFGPWKMLKRPPVKTFSMFMLDVSELT